MKNLISIFILFITIPCFSQTSDFEVVNLFYQGKANNCASIALIKAAMSKYGYKNIFQVTKNDNKYSIKLKDNTELTISKDEYDLAKKYSKFEINETQLSSTEKEEVLYYAYLSYAVIAKYIEKNGFWGCVDNNGNSFHYRKTKSYEESLNFITRTSICTDNCYRLLGLKIKDGKVQNYTGTENMNNTGIILYSWQHAVATYNSKLDCHGTWQDIGTQKICGNKFEFYIELE